MEKEDEVIMYSEKMMEHFRHPKNMGEIENPDGVGTVGNPICVLPETDIISNPNTIPIYKLNVGDKALSHDGKYHNVTRKFRRNYSAFVIKIKNRLGTTTLTPEHLIYSFKVPKSHTYCYNRNKRKLFKYASWWHSADLEKKDIVIYPIPTDVKDIEYIKINLEKSKYDFRSIDVPKRIKVNKNFMRFVGYFLAEGSTRVQKRKTYTTLTFNINEDGYVKDVVNLVKTMFGLSAKIEKKKKRKTINILIYNVHITRFLINLFGNKAEEKTIPEFMMFLPIKKQAELIKGLWYGDGYIDKKRLRASYSTVSKQLSQQMKTLLLRQKIIPSVYEEKARNSKGVKHKKAYRIYVLETPSLKKLSSILGIDFNFKSKSPCNAWIDKNLLFVPITKTEKQEYSGPVHNLEVDASHSYTTNSLLIHNCGDLMSIYIKVKDNRLEDIKFKTFGCAAAIATSSMITEMAKGKTVDEALKINRNNVADALDGLPPIKMHCSNLAADALHAAIKDYLSKKGKNEKS